MSARQLAKQAYSAFAGEKPRSSITEWIEILTSRNYDDEAYDGIPEVVESINIQATGVGEASRAIRKKLKHGDTHQQYRALVILRALVENGGHKFQTSFADSHLIDAIKHLAHDPSTDPKVKKKLLSVLAAWHAQFKDDPSMSMVSSLYRQCRPAAAHTQQMQTLHSAGLDMTYENEKKRQEERERKEKEKEEKRKAKEKARLEAEKKKKAVKRKPFNFEEEKPKILTAIANASQATNNLINAITLVNTEHDSLQTNARVQECLAQVRLARKPIVRYVQLVENEDMIGTLIDTNDRIIAALDTYDTLSKPTVTEQDIKDVQEGLAAAKIHDSELGKLQEKQRAAVQRSIGRAGGASSGKQPATTRSRYDDYDDDDEPRSPQSADYVHPDLQDLSFGPLGDEQRNLPPPLRPSARRSSSDEDSSHWRHGSLSDFSDYQSSDEDAHYRASGSTSAQPKNRNYIDVSDNEGVKKDSKKGVPQEEDPFADPFA
ncbi:hypothetical protein K474DRAFT_1661700, partial [Panus rudis PR-1116 ss-1]